MISGVAAGVTGVITKPVEGALRNGSTGFVRGVGIGVVGVVINPVLGLADGLNSLAQTILVQTSDVRLRPQIRPPRTFDCVLPMELELLSAERQGLGPGLSAQGPGLGPGLGQELGGGGGFGDPSSTLQSGLLAPQSYPVLSGWLALTALSLPAVQAQAQVPPSPSPHLTSHLSHLTPPPPFTCLALPSRTTPLSPLSPPLPPLGDGQSQTKR